MDCRGFRRRAVRGRRRTGGESRQGDQAIRLTYTDTAISETASGAEVMMTFSEFGENALMTHVPNLEGCAEGRHGGRGGSLGQYRMNGARIWHQFIAWRRCGI